MRETERKRERERERERGRERDCHRREGALYLTIFRWTVPIHHRCQPTVVVMDARDSSCSSLYVHSGCTANKSHLCLDHPILLTGNETSECAKKTQHLLVSVPTQVAMTKFWKFNCFIGVLSRCCGEHSITPIHKLAPKLHPSGDVVDENVDIYHSIRTVQRCRALKDFINVVPRCLQV